MSLLDVVNPSVEKALHSSSAKQFLYTSAVTLIFAVCVFFDSEQLRLLVSIEANLGKAAAASFLLLLLSYPLGYLANAASYFALQGQIVAIAESYYSLGIRRCAPRSSFDLRIFDERLGMLSFREVRTFSRVVTEPEELGFSIGIDLSHQLSLAGFVRNCTLLAFLYSVGFAARLEWEEAIVTGSVALILLCLAGMINCYLALVPLFLLLNLERAMLESPVPRGGTAVLTTEDIWRIAGSLRAETGDSRTRRQRARRFASRARERPAEVP